jgi:hypothetical protein
MVRRRADLHQRDRGRRLDREVVDAVLEDQRLGARRAMPDDDLDIDD